MDTETSRSIRQVPPAHYRLKVESYSLISESKGKYDSPYFEAGGYKWRLSFYPNGDERFNDGNYISLYLSICETEILAKGWEVSVNFTLFVYNYRHDDYITFQDRRRFHEMKKEWGSEKLVLLETFKDLSKGYLLDDSCTFGAEVFVISPTLNSVSLSVFGREGISNPIFRWEVKDFSNIGKSVQSKEFTSGGAKWYLTIYPNGYGRSEGKQLSMILYFVEDGIPNNKSTIYADYRFRLISHSFSRHKELSVKYWFSRGGGCSSEIISLEDLHHSSNGYVLWGNLTVEVEFFVMSRTIMSQA